MKSNEVPNTKTRYKQAQKANKKGLFFFSWKSGTHRPYQNGRHGFHFSG